MILLYVFGLVSSVVAASICYDLREWVLFTMNVSFIVLNSMGLLAYITMNS